MVVGLPPSTGLNIFACRNRRRLAEYRDQVARPASFDPKDAKPIVCVVEGHSLDHARESRALEELNLDPAVFIRACHKLKGHMQVITLSITK
jgi:hypothetical protein